MARLGVKITSYLLVINLILIILPPPYMNRPLSSAEGGMPTRSTIIVNASGGGDYTHIQWAIDNASEGDTILVERGIYRENLVIYKPISLMGEGADGTVIDGEGKKNVIFVVSNWVNISGFRVVNSLDDPFAAGIRLGGVHYCTVQNNECINNSNGIRVDRACSGNVIKNNSCYNNIAGINVNSMSDLEWQDYSNSIIENNCFNNSYNYQIRSPWETILECRDNLADGEPVFFLKDKSNQVITEPVAMVLLINCNNITVENISAHNNSFGIYCYGGSDNQIANNTLKFNSVSGIYMGWTNRNIVRNNICSSNRYGYGIYINSYNTTNTIINNICDSNYDGIYFNGIDSFLLNNTCKYNLMNGISMVSNSINNFLKNNICCSNGENGIRMGSSWDNYIMNNNCSSNNESGIYLGYGCGYNLLEYNSCNKNNKSGIHLYYNVYHNFFFNNSLIENSIGMNSSRGSDDNNISYNLFQRNFGLGLCIYESENTVTYNTFDSNNNYALFLNSGSFNTPRNNFVHHNTFINNNHGGIQARDDGYDNIWNVDLGGNYWSDLNKVDNNNDGFVDHIYELDGREGAVDNLPLVNPVGIPLLRAFAGNDLVIDQYESISFDGSNCSGSGYIVNYTWYFHYDNVLYNLYEVSPNFTFSISGNYSVILRVMDAFNRTDKDIVNITVIDITPPIAHAGPDVKIDQHQIATFNASSSSDNVGIVHYNWSFMYDGTEKNLLGEKVSFTFHAVGTYVVILNIIDVEGNWATDTINVTVNDITPPTADAGPDITINQSEAVEFFFHQNSSDNIGCLNWTWSFDYNGTSQLLFHSIHMSSLPFFTFEIPDNYTVFMTVQDEAGNLAFDILNITILESSSLKEPEIDYNNDTEKDSDNDTYNDTYELSQGSDPYNPYSTPFDWDADGWNNSIETEVGTDPRDNLSVPQDMDTDGIPDSLDPDRDGDGVANVNDAYPDNRNQWEKKEVSKERTSTWWWIIGIVSAFIVVGVIVGTVVTWGKNRKSSRDANEDVNGSDEELGRVKREF